VHCHEYSEQGNPSSKGICLIPSRWLILVKHIDALDDILAGWNGGLHDKGADGPNIGIYLGGLVYGKAFPEFHTVGILSRE